MSLAQGLGWSYGKAFARNFGLIAPEEQERLRYSRVAIAGMGGVGGSHLMALARLGVGKFRIADPDVFEIANFNRQRGANLFSVGRNKAALMAQHAQAVNPEIEIDVLQGPVTHDNVESWLDGCDVLLDGVDFFEIETRRLLFATARKLGIWAITAGPIGFSTAWMVFDPRGVSFDRYFDIRDGTPRLEQWIAFGIGLAPKATHLAYIDLRSIDLQRRIGPSVSFACQLCSGVAAGETLKILLGRGVIRPAPFYSQFDIYRHVLRTGRLRMGNRGPLQRAKRFWLKRVLGPKLLKRQGRPNLSP